MMTNILYSYKSFSITSSHKVRTCLRVYTQTVLQKWATKMSIHNNLVKLFFLFKIRTSVTHIKTYKHHAHFGRSLFVSVLC